MPVQKRVRSSPPVTRLTTQEMKPNPYRELLEEYKSEVEYRIPLMDYRLGVLRKNLEVLPDLKRSIESMEFEKQTLIGRLARINAVLDAK